MSFSIIIQRMKSKDEMFDVGGVVNSCCCCYVMFLECCKYLYLNQLIELLTHNCLTATLLSFNLCRVFRNIGVC